MKPIFLIAILAVLASCSNAVKESSAATDTTSAKTNTDTTQAKPTGAIAGAATIMARTQVPVLCYHHIRPLQMPGRKDKGYEVTEQQFKDQMKALHDSGFHTILPEQYYNYLAYGKELPAKPVMLTYDDTDEEQFSIAKPAMDKYNFKGVYFLMTISIGRPRYMSKEQIKQLADEGHSVQCHTFDHSRYDKYIYENTKEIGGRKRVVNDYDLQLLDARKTIEGITGKPVNQFAYPFGIWNEAGIPELKKRDYQMAYQLSTKRDSTEPLHTVRRIIVSPEWSTAGLLRVMESSFKGIK